MANTASQRGSDSGETHPLLNGIADKSQLAAPHFGQWLARFGTRGKRQQLPVVTQLRIGQCIAWQKQRQVQLVTLPEDADFLRRAWGEGTAAQVRIGVRF